MVRMMLRIKTCKSFITQYKMFKLRNACLLSATERDLFCHRSILNGTTKQIYILQRCQSSTTACTFKSHHQIGNIDLFSITVSNKLIFEGFNFIKVNLTEF